MTEFTSGVCLGAAGVLVPALIVGYTIGRQVGWRAVDALRRIIEDACVNKLIRSEE